MCPPVHVLAYAARSIIAPSFIHSMTPQLLRLLAQLESIRLKAVAEAERALQLNKQYENQKLKGQLSPEISLLEKSEKTTLKASTKKEKAVKNRYRFRSSITLLCSLVRTKTFQRRPVKIMPVH